MTADADRPQDPRRRRLLLAATTTALSALAPACAGPRTGTGGAVRAPATPAGTRPASAAAPACVLTPETGEGPYYARNSRARSDIVEDRRGVPLRVELRIVRASKGCAPMPRVAVDVWQADASGIYSRDGATYLRGTQTTDAEGRVSFRTIVPGWYADIAPHVHFKVRPDRHSEVASQLFLPEELLRQVYAGEPYSGRRAPAHPNTRDDRFAAHGPQMMLAPLEEAGGYRASFVVGIA
ncbi:intradiol ring-cleavage dioxygenase [Streptomyces sp. cmx-4-9]|uniref:dioxygenase family protein n=1 Tax=Streptomyces sp. cmx-4-9 TaxID=2790941 RepID=UPI00397F9E2B